MNDEILHLNTTVGDIDTTTNHPFYVIGKGWVAAGDLEVYDELLTIDGSVGYVLSFEVEKLDVPISVYNIEVEEFHTYFVGSRVLVHNQYETTASTGQENGFKLPKTVKSAKGVTGNFTERGDNYRIDTNKVAPGEGGFHLHIYRDSKEIAKITGRSGYVKTHKNQTLLKPSEMNATVRKEINKLVEYIGKALGGIW